MEYQCSVCGQQVGSDLIVYKDHTEQHIVDLIKKDHPEWVEENGVCRECISYFKGEIKGGFMHPTRCAQRRRKAKNMLAKIFPMFKSSKN